MITPFAKPTEEQVSLFCKDSCTVATESRSQKSLYQVLDGLAGFSCELEKTLHCDCQKEHWCWSTVISALQDSKCSLKPGPQSPCGFAKPCVTEQDHSSGSHSSDCHPSPKPACAVSAPEVDFYFVTPQSLSSSCREPAAEVSGCVWRHVELGCGFSSWVLQLLSDPAKAFPLFSQKTAETSSRAPDPTLYSLCLATFSFCMEPCNKCWCVPYGKCSGMRKKLCHGHSSTSCLSNSSMVFPRYQWLQVERQPDSSHAHECLLLLPDFRQTLKRYMRWWKLA